jgi:hypothetical protein
LKLILQSLISGAEAVEYRILVGSIELCEDTSVVDISCRRAILGCGDISGRDCTTEVETITPWHCSIAFVGGKVIQVGVTAEAEVVWVDDVVWIPVDVPEDAVEAGIGMTVTLERIVLPGGGTTEDGAGDGGGASRRVIPKRSIGDSNLLVRIRPTLSRFDTIVDLSG